MENFPLHLVKKIAKGGKGIDPVGRRVAQAELQRRKTGENGRLRRTSGS
jgi:protein-L-isoaspartate O-methyltransferase